MKKEKQTELFAASDTERAFLLDWYQDHSHVDLHDDGLNTLCKICPPEEYGEDEDCEALQNLIRVMYYRLTDLESELKRKDEALRTLVNLKEHKEFYGKDDFYLGLQPKAWAKAEQALKPKS